MGHSTTLCSKSSIRNRIKCRGQRNNTSNDAVACYSDIAIGQRPTTTRSVCGSADTSVLSGGCGRRDGGGFRTSVGMGGGPRGGRCGGSADVSGRMTVDRVPLNFIFSLQGGREMSRTKANTDMKYIMHSPFQQIELGGRRTLVHREMGDPLYTLRYRRLPTLANDTYYQRRSRKMSIIAICRLNIVRWFRKMNSATGGTRIP